ncbi:MAG: c-type cytochrome domain-containing protein, partial [Planctomycetota bacterium]
MRRSIGCEAWMILVGSLGAFGGALQPPASAFGETKLESIDFARDIKPILSDNCFHCHGPDPATRKANLRLDTPEGIAAALSTGGHAVVPGNVDDSELLYRVAPLFE